MHASSDDARLREARAVAKLNHPNLVPLYEVLDDENCVYLISEFCEGSTLAEYLRENGGPLDSKIAGEITVRIARAVAHAHDRGMVHRDIKPSNVLLVTEQVEADVLPFTPRLTDFGLVLELTGPESALESNRLVGTVNFMAPEQIIGDSSWDARLADIYSLGLLLYRMLAGRSPYRATSHLELVEEICTRPLTKLPSLTPTIPADLAAICYKALQREPSARYATARDLVDDLNRWREGRAVSARRQSTLEHLGRIIRREPVVVSLVAVVVLLTTISSITFAWNNQRLRQQGVELQAALQLASEKEASAIDVAYISDMAQAYSAVAKGDSATALSIVARVDEYVSQDYKQRFDWRTLQALAQSRWSRVAKLDSVIEEVVSVPSRDQFVVASEADGLRFISGSDGKIVTEYLTEPGIKLKAVAVSSDGKRLAVGRSSSMPFLLAEIMSTQKVDMFEFEDFLSRSAPGASDKDTRPVAAESWSSFDATVESLAFSGDGAYLAAGSRYEPIQIFKLGSKTPYAILPSDRRNEDLSLCEQELAWMPNPTTVATQAIGSELQVRQIKMPADWQLRRVRMSSDGSWIATALQQLPNSLLYFVNDEKLQAVMLQGLGGEIRSLSFSPNSRFLAAGALGGCVAVWDLNRVAREMKPYRQTEATEDLNVIDTQLRLSPHRFYNIHDSPIAAIAIDDQGTVLSGGADGQIAFIPGKEFQSLERLLPLPPDSRVVAVTDDCRNAFIGCHDGSVWQLDTSTDALVKIGEGLSKPVNYIATSPDNLWVAVGFEDGRLRIRSVDLSVPWTEIPFKSFNPKSPIAVTDIAFNDTQRRLLVIRGKTQLQCVELNLADRHQRTVKTQELFSFHAPTSVSASAILSDDLFFALGDTHYQYNIESSGAPVMKVGSRDIWCGCADRQSDQIVLGTADGRLHRVGRNGETMNIGHRWKPADALAEEVRKITAIVMTPCGNNVVTGASLVTLAFGMPKPSAT